MYVPCRRAASARAASARTVKSVQRKLIFRLKLRNLLSKSRSSFFFDAFFSKTVKEGTFSPLHQHTKQIFEFRFAFHA
eukprot:UN27465